MSQCDSCGYKINEMKWKEININKEIIKRNLAGLDTLRKDDSEPCKAALQWNPQGTRGRGTPRNSWRRTALNESGKHSWSDLRFIVRSREGWRRFVRFQVLTAASMMFRIVFWDVLPCKMIVDRRFRRAYCLHHYSSLMMEAVRTSETAVDNHFTRQYIPEDNSEHLRAWLERTCRGLNVIPCLGDVF
jgi:hypothetical protein